MKGLGRDGVQVNRLTVDLRQVEQLADGEQAAALGYCLAYAQSRHLLDGKHTLTQVVDALEGVLDRQGLEALCENRSSVANLARPRRQELFACFNRCRELRF